MNTGLMGKALIPAGIAWSVLLHLSIIRGVTGSGHLLLLSLPLVAGGGLLVMRAVGARWRPLVALALAALVYGLARGHYLRSGMIAADGLSHASINFFLLWIFAGSLRRGREPLISGVSRHVGGGELTPEVARYTRNVTLAWSTFFAAQLLTSALLYIFAPLPVWSLFINVLNAPSLVLMFSAEFLIRLWRHPAQARLPVARVVEAFTQNLAAARNKGR
ncbi:MAG TPA: hypothetical protein VKC56_00130 [Gallionellaceae bacterium]|nr:hypothetical protein [Gallionellaceae bacterium]